MAAVVAVFLFVAYGSVIPSIRTLPMLGFLGLERSVALLPYSLCVVVGMAMSTRHLARFSSKVSRITWSDAAYITSRQVAYVALCIFIFMFVTKDRLIGRMFLGTYLCLLAGLELLVNQGLPRLLTRFVFGKHLLIPTLFVGTAAQISKLHNWLATKEFLGIEPVGFVTHDSRSTEGTHYPFLGPLEGLGRVIEEKKVAQVIFFGIPTDPDEGRAMIETCQDRGCRLLIYSNLSETLQHPLVMISEEGFAFYALQEEPLEDPTNRMLKRAFDLAISIPVVLFLLPPICLWVWVMQRFQAPGRLLFVQRRAGQRGGEFSMLKFRSMYDVLHDESVQARKADERIYPFGRLIRRTSIDEFPQFLNVLIGNMSIVGPRPHLPAHDAEFSRLYRGYRTRHFAKPGLTGLAQIRGFRGEITDPHVLKKRVESDLYYIANWSFWLDASITLRTFRQVLYPPKTAY
jgi:exopolysaccharide biosynthesis polyprenyl glycosylphosphotransferase